MPFYKFLDIYTFISIWDIFIFLIFSIIYNAKQKYPYVNTAMPVPAAWRASRSAISMHYP